MGFWKRLFGNRKDDALDSEAVAKVLDTFVNAQSWNESQEIVKRHPELLSSQADAMLEAAISDAEADGNHEATALLTERHHVLADCRNLGIETAFSERQGGVLPREAESIINELSQPIGLSDIPHRIGLCERALQLISRSTQPEIWAGLHGELANSFAQTPMGERAENLEQAIVHCQDALSIYTRDAFPVEWAMVQNNLGEAYRNRILGERAKNLEQAIYHCQQALTVSSRESSPVDWAMSQNNLANAYSERILGDRGENLEQAIGHYQQVLSIYTRDAFPVEWAMVQNNLGEVHRNRIRGERAENLEKAIHYCQQALTVRTRESFPVDWAMTQNNLANAYSERILGDRGENIEQAIHHFNQALLVCTQDAIPEWWASIHNNLAAAYLDRIWGKRGENLERAIHLCRQALTVNSREAFPEDWARTQNNLGNAYVDRIRGERAENIEQAITHYEAALAVRTREAFPADWAMTQNNLGNAYLDRIHGERELNIEQAIYHYEQALMVRSREAFPSDWAATQNNLGNAYVFRVHGERELNVEQAIHCFEQALVVRNRKAFPADWAMTQNNLSIAYGNRICGERAENIEQAIHHSRQALEIRTLEALPIDYRTTQHNLIELYVSAKQWTDAIKAGLGALAAGDLLYAVAATPESRRAELREVSDVPSQLSYAFVAAEDNASNRQQAILTFERHRARWLAESLAMSAAQPKGVPDAVWADFTTATTTFRELQAEAQLSDDTPSKRDFLTLSRLLSKARKDIDEAIDAVRVYAPTFMPEPDFADVQRALVDGGTGANVGVYLAATSAGGLVLVVHAEGVKAVQLADLTEETLSGMVQDWFSTYDEFLTQGTPAVRQHWFDRLEATTQELWKLVMGPLATALRDLGIRDKDDASPPIVTLIPTGLLALLPLHAAWTDDPAMPTGRRYFLDEFAIRYAPSATSLGFAREAARESNEEALLAVDEPKPVRLGGPLPNSAAEVDAVADCFAHPTYLRHDGATKSAVLAELPSTHVAHFSCHGTNDWENPLHSGLLMAHDELLTVRNLLELRLSAKRLASLSACETGIVGTDLPDEAIMFPSALLQAGYGGVLASLWSVADVSTAMLMARFYAAWREEGMEPAQALRVAQRWVRDTTNAEKAAYFRQHIFTRRGGARLPSEVAKDFFMQVLDKPEQDARDFAHPFWWAAFTLTGV